jgi:hypothetical protein
LTGISAFSKENPLKMSEFLKNKYFCNEKFLSYILIPEKVLILPQFLKNKNFVERKSPKNV